MNSVSREYRRRQIEEDTKRHRKTNLLKRQMGKVLFARIQEVLDEDPTVTEFDTPLLRPLGIVEEYLIKNHPDEITRHVAIGRHVVLQLDETVTPPMMHIELRDEEPGQE